LSINRNKESVALDFRKPEGTAILERLIAKADVLVENFRPGTLESAGFGYATLSAKYPRLVYVSISGYGQNGPRRDEPGYDAVVQGEGGLMSITGEADGPAVRLGVAIGDLSSGMFAFQGLLLALLARGRTGRGQWVDISLLDSVAALLTYQASRHFATGEIPARAGNRHLTIAPYETFDTADGVLVLAVGNDSLWQRFCRAASLDALASDERFATNADRVTNYAILQPLIARRLATRPLDDWVATLRGAGVPCGGVRSVADVLRDPQILAREMVASVDHPALGAIRMLGVPVKLSDTPGSVRTPPPRLGEHTARVLREDLKMNEAEIQALSDRNVVRTVV
jgi:formyl-CoA transferase/CoA:oxalate CoA-transferase